MRKRAGSTRWRGIFEALGFGRRENSKSVQSLKRRSLHLEPLEERQLLTVLCWDPAKSGGANLGGQGAWTNGGDNIWWNGQADVAWNSANGDAAVFQGTAGMVTVGSGVSAGSIGLETSGYTIGSGTITLTQSSTPGWANGEIRADSSGDQIGSALAGSVGLTKTGTGTLTLAGASSYSGTTLIQNGTLALAGGDNRLPVGTTVALSTRTTAGILQLGDEATGYNQTLAGLTRTSRSPSGSVIGGGANLATLTLDISSSDTYQGTLGGSGTNANNLTLVKTGPDNLTLSTATYSGGTTISDGTLTWTGGNLGSGGITLAGGALVANGTIGNAIVAQANTTSYLGAYYFPLTLTGSISGSGTIVNDWGVTLNLGGDNSGFSGTFETMSGPTCFTSAAAGSSNATWEIDGGVLTADVPAAATIALGSLTGDVDGILRNDSADVAVTYQIGDRNESTEFDGVIEDDSGPVALAKTGTGTLTLTGASTYSGSTAIQGGSTLIVAGGDNRLPIGTTVTGIGYGGGTLQLGDGTTASNQTLAGITGHGSVVGGGVGNANLTLAIRDGVLDTYNGYLGGSGTDQNNLSLTIQGAGPDLSGEVLLNGNSTYSGGTTLESGLLIVTSDGFLGSGLISLAGGSLEPNGTFSNNVLVESETTSHIAIPINPLYPLSSVTLNGNISGTGTLYCTSPASGKVVNLGGDNSGFTGTFEQCMVTTYFTSPNAGSANATWQIDSGTLAADVSGTQTIHLGALSGSGTLTNAMAGSTTTFEVGGKNQSSEFDGVIQNGSGTVALTKLGSATLTLGGTNAYTGGTTINAGTLQLGNGATNGAVAGNIADNSGLIFANASPQTYSGVISGSGTLTMTGSDTLTLTGANTYSGGTTISGGTLQVGDGHTTGALGYGNIAVGDGDSLVFDRSNAITETYAISGLGSVVQAGTGTLYLTGDNTYTGATTINAGTLSFADDALDSTSSIAFTGGTLQWAGGNTEDISSRIAPIGSGQTAIFDTNGNDVTFTSGLVGAGGLSKIGDGTLTLSTANAYGNTTLQGGTLNFVAGGLGSGQIHFTGGTLQWAHDKSDSHHLILNTQDISSQIAAIPSGQSAKIDTNGNDVVFGTTLTGAGGLTKLGLGTLTLDGRDTDDNGDAITSYAGTTTISGGALQVGSDDTNGMLGSGNVVDNSSLAFDRRDDITVDNTISGTGTVAQNGAGTLYLTGENTYSGGTAINAGTLQLGDGTSSMAGAIANNAALVFANTSAQTYSGPISGSGTLTMIGTGTLSLAGTSTYTGDTILDAGTLSVTGSIASSTVTINGGTLSGSGTTGDVTANGGDFLPATSSTGTNVSGNLLLTKDSAFDAALTNSGGNVVHVTGTVQLGDASLNTTGITRTTAGGGPFVLISNDGTEPVIGTFAGLSEGASVVADGVTYYLTYKYNTTDTTTAGNDVALIAGPYVVVSGNDAVLDNYTYTLNLSAKNLGSHSISQWSIDWNDGSAPTSFVGATMFVPHNYQSSTPQVYTIAATATDNSSPAITYTYHQTVTVFPQLTASGSSDSVQNGQLYSLALDGEAVQAGTASNALQVVVNWGDGQSSSYTAADLASSTWPHDSLGRPVVTHTYHTIQSSVLVTTDMVYGSATFTDATLTQVSVSGVPRISTSAAASLAADHMSASLSVSAVAGVGSLSYAWATTMEPVGLTGSQEPTFSNGTANTTNVAFHAAGSYQFTVTVADGGGCSVSSTVVLLVSQTFTGVTISPASPTLDLNQTESFSAVANDQFNNAMMDQPTFSWSASAGTFDAHTSGLYTTPSVAGTPTITATSQYTSGNISGTTSVIVANAAPTVATAASASDSIVTGTSTTLSVLGDDDGGEANLTYTWSVTSPEGVTAPTFGAGNGANAGKTITVTFSSAGTYTFVVGISDGHSSANSLTLDDRTVTVTVEQVATAVGSVPAITISSPSGSLEVGQSYSFTASAVDQFGHPVTSFAWSATAGSIDQSGNFTPDTPLPVTITATCGDMSGSASVTVANDSPTTVLRRGEPADVSLWEQTLGDAATQQAWIDRFSGVAPITLSSAYTYSYTITPASTAAPTTFVLKNPVIQPSDISTPILNSLGQQVGTSRLVITGTLDANGNWTYEEQETVSCQIVNGGTSPVYETWGYDFLAGGNAQTSNFTCTVTASYPTTAITGQIVGTAADGTPIHGTWTRFVTNTDVITPTSRSGSGSAIYGYAGTGDDAVGINGADETSYDYSIGYAAGATSTASNNVLHIYGSDAGKNGTTNGTNNAYTSYSYDSGTWSLAGGSATSYDSGDLSSGGSDSAQSSGSVPQQAGALAALGLVGDSFQSAPQSQISPADSTSGAISDGPLTIKYYFSTGTTYDDGGWHKTGSGYIQEHIKYDLPIAGGTDPSANPSVKISGDDNVDFGCTVIFEMKGDGTWLAKSGIAGGTDVTRVVTNYSTSGSNFSASGQETIVVTVIVSDVLTDGTWAQPSGSTTVTDIGWDQDSYSARVDYTSAGATWNSSEEDTLTGSDFDNYGGTVNYTLQEDPDNPDQLEWAEQNGNSNSSGNGSCTLTWTGSGTYGATSNDPMHGTFSYDGSDKTTYNFLVNGADIGGTWTYGGTASSSETDKDNYSYTGGAAYQNSQFSGTMTESGSGNDTSSASADYNLAPDQEGDYGWSLSGGSEKISGSFKQSNSYDGAGSYTKSWGSVVGALKQSGTQSLEGNYYATEKLATSEITSSGGSETYDSTDTESYSGQGGNSPGVGYVNWSLTQSGDETTKTHNEFRLSLSLMSGDWSVTPSRSSTSDIKNYGYSYTRASSSKSSYETNINLSQHYGQVTDRTDSQWTGTGPTTITSSESGNGGIIGYDLTHATNYDSYMLTSSTDIWLVPASGQGGADTYTSLTIQYPPLSVDPYSPPPTPINGVLTISPNYAGPPLSTDGGPTPSLAVTSTSSNAMVGGLQAAFLGSSSRFASGYDSAGRLSSLTDLNGGLTSFGYDAIGNLSSLTDAMGNTTHWSFDGQNRLTSQVDQLGDTKSYAYDDAGNLAQYTDANGRANTYQYDSAGNVTGETWYAPTSPLPSGEDQGEGDSSAAPTNTITYTRDSAGRITSESDNNSADSYTYTAAGQIASTTEALPNGPTVVLDYQYNPAGERTEMAATIDGTPDFVDDYAYNAAGEVISVTEHGVTGGDAVANKEIDLTYNSAGELATVDRYQDGVLAVEGDYTYDSAGDLTGLVYRQGDTVLASYAWTYSSDGSPLLSGEGQGEGAFVWSPSGGIVPVHDTTGVTAALSSGGFAGLAEVTSCTSTDGMTSYSYDPTGELLAATYTGGQAAESYTYDANGNRVTANGYVYASGADNRLLSDGTYTYAYDGEGNRTEKFIDANHDGVLDAGDTDVTQFTWDNRDRLTEVKTYATEGGDPTEVVDYLYDVENRWIGENIYSPLPSGEGQGEGFTEHQIRFAYDGNQIVLQFDKDGSGQLDASNLSHRYTWLPNAVDQLMSDEQVSTPAQAGQVVWTLGDNQGTIKDLAVMDSGVTSVVNHRVFDSYGNLVSQTNSAVDCLFGYTGRAKDNVTGLQNNLNRWYDSRVAGWLSQDPTGFLAGQTNLYVYCGNSPLTFVDPRGLEATTIGGAMIAAWVYTQAAAAATGAAIVAGETAAIAGCAYGGYKAGEALSTITTVPLVNWYYSDSAEPASEKTAKDMARQIERDLGPEARDKFHDLKGAGEPDRTLEELKDDAQRIYEEYGRTPPKWMQ